MTNHHFYTIRDLLRYAVTRFNSAKLFFGHGSTNALDKAAYLILHTLHLPLDKLEPFFDARLLPEEIDAVLKVIDRRAIERIPAAYLTNEAWLGGYRFYVDQRVIVPRSFISELIPEQFTPWVEHPEAVTHILELCTGSGCLPIMLADAFPNAHVDTVDISADALAVAQINIERHGLQQRIETRLSDGLQQATGKYDLIVCNPPYVNEQSMGVLPEEFLAEPSLALDGGADGMGFIRGLLEQAPAFMTDDGVMLLEIGHEIEHFNRAFPALDVMYLSTSAGDEQVMLITRQALLS